MAIGVALVGLRLENYHASLKNRADRAEATSSIKRFLLLATEELGIPLGLFLVQISPNYSNCVRIRYGIVRETSCYFRFSTERPWGASAHIGDARQSRLQH